VLNRLRWHPTAGSLATTAPRAAVPTTLTAAVTAAGAAAGQRVEDLAEAHEDTGAAHVDGVDAVGAVGRVSAAAAREPGPGLAVPISLMVLRLLFLRLGLRRSGRTHWRLRRVRFVFECGHCGRGGEKKRSADGLAACSRGDRKVKNFCEGDGFGAVVRMAFRRCLAAERRRTEEINRARTTPLSGMHSEANRGAWAKPFCQRT